MFDSITFSEFWNRPEMTMKPGRKKRKRVPVNRKKPTAVSSKKSASGDLVLYLWIFLAALVIRVVYLNDSGDAPTFSAPIIDSQTYLSTARNFAETKSFTHDFFWQPFFYPFFLSLVSLATRSVVIWAKILQAIIGALSCVLSYILGREIFGKRVGILAAFIVCVYGPLIFFGAELLAAVWAAFWAPALILLFMRAQKRQNAFMFFLLGLSGGLAIITRPNFLLFFLAGCIWLVFTLFKRKQKPGEMLLPFPPFFAGLLMILLPVCFVNRRVTGTFGFLPYSGGINTYIGSNADYSHTVSIRPGYEWTRLTALPLESGAYGTQEEQKYFYKKALEFMTNRPFEYFNLLVAKTIRFFNSREIPRNVDVYLFRKWSGLLTVLVWKIGGFGFPFGLLLPFSVIGLISSPRRFPLPFLLFLLLFPLSVILVFVSARYRIPMAPVFAVAASAGFFSLYEAISQKRRRQIHLMIPAGIVVLVLSAFPRQFNEEKINYEAEIYYALGNRAGEEKDVETAIDYYKKSIEIEPDLFDARNNMGAALVNLGALDEGIEEYRFILKDNPEREDVLNNLGMALVKKERFEDGVLQYKKALKINPHFTDAYYNLANALGATGKTREAMNNYKLAIRTKPGCVKALYNLGNLYASRGDFENAARQYREALLWEPHNPEVKTNLANAYFLQGEIKEAERLAREVLSNHPGFAPAANILQRIKNPGEIY